MKKRATPCITMLKREIQNWKVKSANVKQNSAKRKQLTNSRLSRTNTESRISGICTSLAELKRKWNKEKHACKTRKQITNQEEKHACKTRKQITNQEEKHACKTRKQITNQESRIPAPCGPAPRLLNKKGIKNSKAHMHCKGKFRLFFFKSE